MAPIPRPSTLLSDLISRSSSVVSSLASLAPRTPLSLAPTRHPHDSALPRTLATRTLPAKLLSLVSRQSNPSIIPTTYGSLNSGPSPGTIVGIVLGSVGGFLILLWLIYTCMNFGVISSSSSYTESVVVRERRKSHSARSRRASETVEIRRERSPVRIVREPERVERIIVEETRETRRDRSRGGSDEVVVIEEHSPPRRKKSVKEERRESGYRVVDPLAYGGTMGGRKSSRRGGR